MGALAVGAVAIGVLAIGRLSIKRMHVRRLEIDEIVMAGKVTGPDEPAAAVQGEASTE